MIPSLGGGPQWYLLCCFRLLGQILWNLPQVLFSHTRNPSASPSAGSCSMEKILTTDMLAVRGEPHDPRTLETTIHLCQDCPFAVFVWFHVQVWTGEALGATPTLPPPMGMTSGTCSPSLCPKTTEEGLAAASSTPSGTSGRSATDVSSMKLASLTSRSLLSPLMTPRRGPCLLVGHMW